MEKRVEMLFSDSPSGFKYQLNAFLKETGGKLHDIKYLMHEDEYIAFLTYTPEGENEEKDETTKKSSESDAGIFGKRVALRV